MLSRLQVLRGEHPEKKAIAWTEDGETEVCSRTYNQLVVEAQRVSWALSEEWMVANGEKAALIYPPGPNFVAAFLGCLGCGVVAVPLRPPNPVTEGNCSGAERLAREADFAGCTVALTVWSFSVTVAQMMSRCSALRRLRWYYTDVATSGKLSLGSRVLCQCPPACTTLSGFQDEAISEASTAYLELDGRASDGTLSQVEVPLGCLLMRVERWRPLLQGKDTVMVCWFAQHAPAGLLGGILAPLWVGGTTYLIPQDEFLKSPLVWFKTLSIVEGTATIGINQGYDLVRRHWMSLEAVQRPDINLSTVEKFGCRKEDRWQEMVLRMFETFVNYGLSWDKFKACAGLRSIAALPEPEPGRFHRQQRVHPAVCPPLRAMEALGSQALDLDTCREPAEENCEDGTSESVPREAPFGVYWRGLGDCSCVMSTTLRQVSNGGVIQKPDKEGCGQDAPGPSGKVQFVHGEGQPGCDAVGLEDSNFFYVGHRAGDYKRGRSGGSNGEGSLEGSGSQLDSNDFTISFDFWKRGTGQSGQAMRTASVELSSLGDQEPNGGPQGTVLDRLWRRKSFVWDSAEYPKGENTGISFSDVEKACQNFDILRRVSEGHEPSELSKISSWNSCTEVSKQSSWRSSLAEMQSTPASSYAEQDLGGRLSSQSQIQPQISAFSVESWLVDLFCRYGVQDFSTQMYHSGIPSRLLQRVLDDVRKHCGVELNMDEVLTNSVSRIIRRVVERKAVYEGSCPSVGQYTNMNALKCQANEDLPERRSWLCRSAQHMMSTARSREVPEKELKHILGVPARPNTQTLKKPLLALEPRGMQMSKVGQACLQMIGMLGIVLLFSASMLPSLALVVLVSNEHNSTWPLSHLWHVSHTGAMALLFPVVILLFAVAFSGIVIISKWLIVGRYKEGAMVVWSSLFARWWFMDRLLSVWDLVVGKFVSGTCFYNLFCYLMGAHCPLLLAEITQPLREFDLLYIGEHARIRGNIYCRSLLPGKLFLAPVTLEVGAKIESLAVVLPGCTLAACSILEPLGVLLEGSSTTPGTVYSGNPATAVGKTRCRKTRSAKSLKQARQFSIAKAATLVINFYIAVTIAVLVLPLLELVGAFPDSFRYTPVLHVASIVFGGGAILMALTVGLKWLLLGKVRPAIIVESHWRQWRVWCVDSFARFPMWALSVWLQRTPIINLWYCAMGTKVPIVSSSIPPEVVPPSAADLVSFGSNVFASGFIVKTKGDPPKEIAMESGSEPGAWITIGKSHFGAGASVGLSSVCGPGFSCGKQSIVGPVTRVGPGIDYPDGTEVFGNPAQAVNRKLNEAGVIADIAEVQSEEEDTENMSGSESIFVLFVTGIQGIMIRIILITFFVALATIPAYEGFVSVFSFPSNSELTFRRLITAWAAFTVMLLGLQAGLLSAFLCFDAIHRLAVYWGHPVVTKYHIRSFSGFWITEHSVFSDVLRTFFVNPLLSGSAFIRWLYRSIGANIGDNVYLTNVAIEGALNLDIGDGSVVDNSECMGCKQLGDILQLGPVTIGKECTVQAGSVLLSGDKLEDDSLVGPRTKPEPEQVLSTGMHWHGAPAVGYSIDQHKTHI